MIAMRVSQVFWDIVFDYVRDHVHSFGYSFGSQDIEVASDFDCLIRHLNHACPTLACELTHLKSEDVIEQAAAQAH
jgi:hypothetical protein